MSSNDRRRRKLPLCPMCGRPTYHTCPNDGVVFTRFALDPPAFAGNKRALLEQLAWVRREMNYRLALVEQELR